MRRLMLLALVALMLSPVLAMADDQNPPTTKQKNYEGFYRETKYGFGWPILSGIYFQTKRNEEHNYYITALRVTKSFWGYHNDRLVLGNFSLSLVGPYYGAGQDPNLSLGLGIEPIGLRLFGHEKLSASDDIMSAYLLPSYTYLIGLNGRVAHRHAFGAELTLIFGR